MVQKPVKTTQSDIIFTMLRNALEYNANINAMAIAYLGVINTPKYNKRFISEYKTVTKQYIHRQEQLANELSMLIIPSDNNHIASNNGDRPA